MFSIRSWPKAAITAALTAMVATVATHASSSLLTD